MRYTASTISTALSTTNPVRPWTTISGTLPRRSATTGVPDAIASAMTRPNGSSQHAAKQQRRGASIELALEPGISLANKHDPRTEVGPDQGVEVLLLGRLIQLSGQDQLATRCPGNVDRHVCALLRTEPPDEQEIPTSARTHRV